MRLVSMQVRYAMSEVFVPFPINLISATSLSRRNASGRCCSVRVLTSCAVVRLRNSVESDFYQLLRACHHKYSGSSFRRPWWNAQQRRNVVSHLNAECQSMLSTQAQHEKLEDQQMEWPLRPMPTLREFLTDGTTQMLVLPVHDTSAFDM